MIRLSETTCATRRVLQPTSLILATRICFRLTLISLEESSCTVFGRFKRGTGNVEDHHHPAKSQAGRDEVEVLRAVHGVGSAGIDLGAFFVILLLTNSSSTA